MKKLILKNDNKCACLRVLESVSQKMTFKRDETKLLNRVIKWMETPSSQFTYRFCITLSNNGESTNINIAYDGWFFSMSQFNVARYADSGSEWYNAYEYQCSPEETNELGDVYDWESMAMELLGYLEQEGDREMLEVSISKNE